MTSSWSSHAGLQAVHTSTAGDHMALIETRTTSTGKSYRARVKIKGHPTVTATFPKKSQAQAWAVDTESDIRNNRYGRKAEAAKHTLKDAIAKFDATGNQGAQLKWWAGQLGDYALAAIAPAMIRDALEAKDCSPATKNRYLAPLSKVFQHAVKVWYWCDGSPVDTVERWKEAPKSYRPLDGDEPVRLLEASKGSTNPLLYPAVLGFLLTGVRLREQLFLARTEELYRGTEKARGWVDLKERCIYLQDTKNKEPRIIPLTDELHRAYRSIVPVVGNPFLFPSKRSGGPADLRKALVAACASAGVENFTWHGFRHTFGTVAGETGSTHFDIMVAMGHRTVKASERYLHARPDHAEKVMGKVQGRLLG